MIGSCSCWMWLGLLAFQTSRRSVLAFAPSSITAIHSSSAITRLFAESEEKAPRHDVRSNMASIEIDPQEAKIQAALAQHQQDALKLSYAQDIRTLVQYNHGFAVMSTNSKS